MSSCQFIMSERKRRICELDAKSIAFYRKRLYDRHVKQRDKKQG